MQHVISTIVSQKAENYTSVQYVLLDSQQLGQNPKAQGPAELRVLEGYDGGSP